MSDKKIKTKKYTKNKLRSGKAPALLREWASSRDISLTVLGDTLGIARSSLSLYLNGTVLPNIENAARLYKATHGMVDFIDWVHADDLVQFEDLEFEQREIGRPPKIPRKKKQRKKKRKEPRRYMSKKQTEKATEEKRKLETQARLLQIGQMQEGFIEA